ncbi:MAG: hypothetical protein RR744_00295 [Cellulosilyticaceae bacterium]
MEFEFNGVGIDNSQKRIRVYIIGNSYGEKEIKSLEYMIRNNNSCRDLRCFDSKCMLNDNYLKVEEMLDDGTWKRVDKINCSNKRFGIVQLLLDEINGVKIGFDF